MAIAATCVWEARYATGSANNGGGYVSGAGVDYSLQAAAQLTVTDAASTSTTNLNSVTGGFTSNMVNNIVNVVGQGRKQITAYVDTNNVTCDSAWGTFSGATANVGGALQRLDDADTAYRPGNIIYIESGTDTKTTTRTLTCDGTLLLPILFIGYPSGGSRSNVDITVASMPVITTATSSVAKITGNGSSYCRFRNLNITDTAATRGHGITSITAQTTHWTFTNCVLDGCLTGVLGTSAPETTPSFLRFVNCTFKNNTRHGFEISDTAVTALFTGCWFDSNATCGWTSVSTSGAHLLMFRDCVFSDNGSHGMSFLHTTFTITRLQVLNCAFDNNGGAGLNFAFTTGGIGLFDFISNVIYGNTTYGVTCATSGVLDTNITNYGNAYGANTSGARSNFAAGEGDITLTADPFTNRGSDDYTLNSTAGGGAALRQAGYPIRVGALGATCGSSYPDVGAAQVVASAGGGGGPLVGPGRLVRA